MALTSNIAVNIVTALTSSGDLETTKSNTRYSKGFSLASGTGANQADLIFSDTRTLSASGTEDLDLAGSLTDALGTTLTFARVKAILISAAAGNTNNVVVGGASSNGFATWVSDATDEVIVRPGGLMLLYAPDATAYAVTAGTGDLLTVTNSAGSTSVTYDIIIIGASA